MRILIGAVIAVLAIHCSASSQVKHGTIAVIYYTAGKIIVAADSRDKLVGNDGLIRHNDEECKLAALGDQIAFVASGFAGYDKNGASDQIATWRVSGEAHQAYSDVLARLNHKPNGRIVWLVAARWAELVRGRTAELYSVQPHKAADNAQQGLLTSALFSGVRPDGSLTVLVVQIRLGPAGIEASGPKEVTTKTCQPCALGDASIFLEFFNKTSERARDEAARWDIRRRQLSHAELDRLWTIRFVDLTILLYPDPNEVGGFIDALELTRRGVTWIQRKVSCPAQ